jgi:hypothetical protein
VVTTRPRAEASPPFEHRLPLLLERLRPDLEREPPAYAIPRDRSNIVRLEIPTGHLLGDGRLVLRYDDEMRSIAPSGNAVILRMQWEFD